MSANSQKILLRTPRASSLYLATVLCAGALMGPGCQTSGPRLIRDGSGPFAANNATLVAVTAEQELAAAKRMLRAGEQSRAIPRLNGITTQYAGTDAGVEAWYVLGLAYWGIDGHYNAEQYFRKYLALAPDGEYAALSREYLAGIESAAEQRDADRTALESRVANATGAEKEELAAHLALAETYWHDGDFEKAGTIYANVLRAWPSLAEDAVIRHRMELGPDGTYIVLTPDEVERRQSDAEPMVVFNVQSFRSGRLHADHYAYREEYYNVTGQTVNRGESPLSQTSVTVTIYGFAGRVYDTQTVQLGRLMPGETRAFSVRFSHFDNIENVHRHECTVNYSR